MIRNSYDAAAVYLAMKYIRDHFLDDRARAGAGPSYDLSDDLMAAVVGFASRRKARYNLHRDLDTERAYEREITIFVECWVASHPGDFVLQSMPNPKDPGQPWLYTYVNPPRQRQGPPPIGMEP